MGLTLEETQALSAEELKHRMDDVRRRMFDAGADAVLDSISDLPQYIDKLNEK